MLTCKNMENIDKKGFFTTAEVAEMYKISRIAIFKRIKKGTLKAEKVGRNYIIKKEDIKDILDKLHEENILASVDGSENKSLSQISLNIREISELYYTGKFAQEDLFVIAKIYDKNIENLTNNNKIAWLEVENQSASLYIQTFEKENDKLADYLLNIKKVTGLSPKNPLLGHKESINQYIMRSLLKAKLDNNLAEISL